MKDLPVACSLTPDALSARREGLLADLARQVQSREDLPDGIRLRFDGGTATISTIARTIEAERRCCRFLRFTLTVEPDGGPIALDLTGPPGTREFLDILFE